MNRGNAAGQNSFAGHLGKGSGHDSGTFLDGDDAVARDVGELVDLAAGPGDFQRIDLGASSQAKMNARIAGGHIAHATFGLFDVRDAVGGQLERRTNPIAIGLSADEQDFEPVIGVATIVAEKLRKIATIVGGDVNVPVVVEIGSGQAAAGDGPNKVWTQRIGNFFELPRAEV